MTPDAPRERSLGETTGIVLRAFLPGALAGAQLAGLLFFLNPQIPFEIQPVLRGVTWFGALLGGVSLATILAVTWRRPERSRRLLPWSLTIVLTAAAVGIWTHASYYSFYLPSGINRRLIKAAIGLSAVAVASFYTALLRHRRRKIGLGSHLVLLLVAIASIYVIMERREAFKPPLEASPRATTFQGNPRPRLCLVGIEAATLDAILPLAEEGRLPFFARMLQEGAHARLRSLPPPRRAPLWTTLATGRYPFEHGIVAEETYQALFLSPRERLGLLPIGVAFRRWGVRGGGRPMVAADRRALTLWEILARLDIRAGVVGWPLTSPPPQTVQLALSERFFVSPDDAEAWPRELAERARLFHTRIEDLDPARVSRFGTEPPAAVLTAFAADQWRQDLGFFLLEQEPAPEAFFVVLPGLREISRLYFGGYSAARFEGVQDSVSEKGAQLLSAYYTSLDEFLARLWERTPEPRLLAVVSVHGVEDAHGWREAWRVLRRRPALRGYFDRGPDGVLLFLGEGIRAGQLVQPAEIVDVVPTLLYGLGLPLARDHGGAVLTSAFDTAFLARRPLTFLPSYETFTSRHAP